MNILWNIKFKNSAINRIEGILYICKNKVWTTGINIEEEKHFHISKYEWWQQISWKYWILPIVTLQRSFANFFPKDWLVLSGRDIVFMSVNHCSCHYLVWTVHCTVQLSTSHGKYCPNILCIYEWVNGERQGGPTFVFLQVTSNIIFCK